MYVPRHFATDETQALRDLIDIDPLVQVVSMSSDGLVASALPMLLVEDGEHLRLEGHFARPNEHWKVFDPSIETLAIVGGPGAYVSPNNYATKALTHEVVPTWNYEAVHARGPMTIHDDPDWVLDLVTRLTDRHESGRSDAWSVADAPAEYIQLRLRGIVGVALEITKLEAKAKLSQDKSEDDQAGVRRGLGAGTEAERHIAGRMSAPGE